MYKFRRNLIVHCGIVVSSSTVSVRSLVTASASVASTSTEHHRGESTIVMVLKLDRNLFIFAIYPLVLASPSLRQSSMLRSSTPLPSIFDESISFDPINDHPVYHE